MKFCITLLCVLITLCKKHFIIETENKEDNVEHEDHEEHEEHDDIEAEIVPIYTNRTSGDYSLSVSRDCRGVALKCKVRGSSVIEEDTCIFT